MINLIIRSLIFQGFVVLIRVVYLWGLAPLLPFGIRNFGEDQQIIIIIIIIIIITTIIIIHRTMFMVLSS